MSHLHMQEAIVSIQHQVTLVVVNEEEPWEGILDAENGGQLERSCLLVCKDGEKEAGVARGGRGAVGNNLEA